MRLTLSVWRENARRDRDGALGVRATTSEHVKSSGPTACVADCGGREYATTRATTDIAPQSSQITGHRMVVIEPLHNLVQPYANLTHSFVKTPTQLLLDLCELGMHLLGHRHAPELKPALATCDATYRPQGKILNIACGFRITKFRPKNASTRSNA
jgi:hypothetical protein